MRAVYSLVFLMMFAPGLCLAVDIGDTFETSAWTWVTNLDWFHSDGDVCGLDVGVLTVRARHGVAPDGSPWLLIRYVPAGGHGGTPCPACNFRMSEIELRDFVERGEAERAALDALRKWTLLAKAKALLGR